MTGSNRELLDLLRTLNAEIIERSSLEERIGRGRPLRVKLGIDPTSPNIHIGFVVLLRILAAFQDAGHQAVLIIGDFTGQVGDPSDRGQARRRLTTAEVKANQRTYLSQIGTILDIKKTEVHKNSRWFGAMRLAEFLELLTHFSLKSSWQREDFQKRLRAGREVKLYEAMYPVLQGYDSVRTKTDVEIGGFDQRLNLLAGRELQKAFGQKPQEIIMSPYLIGLDGKLKMSKSVGNTINVLDAAEEMFGKVMAVPDSLVGHYALLAAWLSPRDVEAVNVRLKRENPRDVKLDVAEAVVRLYHGGPAADKARRDFTETFSKKVLALAKPVGLSGKNLSPVELVLKLGAAASKSEARRLISGGAVEVDGRPVSLDERELRLVKGTAIKIGKRKFYRVS